MEEKNRQRRTRAVQVGNILAIQHPVLGQTETWMVLGRQPQQLLLKFEQV